MLHEIFKIVNKLSQTKHSTGTELESKQLTIQMGQTEVRSPYAYLN